MTKRRALGALLAAVLLGCTVIYLLVRNSSLSSTGQMPANTPAETEANQGSQAKSREMPPTIPNDGSVRKKIEPDGRPHKDQSAAQKEKGRDSSHSRRHHTAQETPGAPTDEELLEQSLGKLNRGTLAYSTPEKMKTGRIAHVTARIGSDKVSLETLESGMLAEKHTQIQAVSTAVSTKMKMMLKSADFDITPLSSEEQIVAGDSPTTWEWDILPKHAGNLRLHLAAIVELKELSKDFTAIDREIPVQVDPVEAATKFIDNNWQWIIATLTALAGGVWKFINNQKRTEPSSPVGGAAET